MNPGIGMWSEIRKTMLNEGAKGFFKGMGPPLVTVPLVNSLLFVSYEFSKRIMGVKSEKEFTFV